MIPLLYFESLIFELAFAYFKTETESSTTVGYGNESERLFSKCGLHTRVRG